MMQRTATVLVTVFVMLVGTTGLVAGQSITLTDTRNSLIVGTALTISGQQPLGIEMGTAYSIAGVLDIGFVYATSLGAAEETRTDIGLSYAVALVKQNAMVPLSLQLYGEYTHRSVQSDFLSRNRLLLQGQGYGVGLIVARDFPLVDWLSLRVGAVTKFTRYTETTELAFVYDPDTFIGEPDVDYREYPLVDRLSSLSYGPYTALVGDLPNGLMFGVSLAGLFDQEGFAELRPALHLAFSR